MTAITDVVVATPVFLASDQPIRYIHSRQAFRTLPIEAFVFWGPGRQAIDVAVHHAEVGSDQNGIVNLKVRGPQPACLVYIFGRNAFATPLNFPSDIEEGLHFFRDNGRGQAGRRVSSE
jgi:hypothetical protein